MSSRDVDKNIPNTRYGGAVIPCCLYLFYVVLCHDSLRNLMYLDL